MVNDETGPRKGADDDHSTSLWAFAAFLQAQMNVVVTVAFLVPAETDTPSAEPSSIVTIYPFAAAGLRRLVLNVKSDWIRHLANVFAYSADKLTRESLVKVGEAMIWTATKPIAGLDVTSNIHWRFTRGLIATPDSVLAWPVPHVEIPSASVVAFPSLCIWPERVCHARKAHPTTEEAGTLVTHVSEVWQRRDEGLQLEWQAMLQHTAVGAVNPTAVPDERDQTYERDLEWLSPHMGVITMAPSLPMYCLASAWVQTSRVPSCSALSEAANWLISHDRMFALSLWFGVPLVDRTGILKGLVKTVPVAHPPPTPHDVESFVQRYQMATGDTAVHDVLSQVLLRRADHLWKETGSSGSILVSWSGGIDSTATLCALLQTQPKDKSLTVLLDGASVSEHTSFYHSVIKQRQLPVIPREGLPLSTHSVRWKHLDANNLLVTGELGDQLFGSDRCATAFLDPDLEPLVDTRFSDTAKADRVLFDQGLEGAWQETVLLALESLGLMAAGGRDAWEEWITPQLARSPVPIRTTFDFLWWINFSCKWQTVRFRCIHDGGTPLLDSATDVATLTGCIRHFYDDSDLECWSCCQESHRCKLPDKKDWKTYKEPLKKFILDFDGDEVYYREKQKTPSLCFGAPSGPESYCNRFYGVVLESDPDDRFSTVGSGSRPRLLTWGVSGMFQPQGLGMLIESSFVTTVDAYPSAGVADVVEIDPWHSPTWGTSPFDVAPYFAQEDERQSRQCNPVTEITLTAKCAALLTPEVVEGRTFLDLGACLGASCHWALCMGASKATAVEVQNSFCERASTMLQRAQASRCWPGTDGEFEVIRCGIREYLSASADGSHDVVLAAGVLHCFADPLQILGSMARVAKEAVLIEMTHPSMYLNGSLSDRDTYSSVANQMTCPIQCSAGPTPKPGLEAAVRPLSARVEEAGLMQVAPQAWVNMAESNRSFKGFATLPSRAAIEKFMNSLGFDVVRVLVAEHPFCDQDVRTYTSPKNFQALPMRYFLRCVRRVTVMSDSSLESLVISDDRTKSHDWSDRQSWYSFPSKKRATADGITDMRSNHTQEVPTPSVHPRAWVFDESVAARFGVEARCHIPDYEACIEDAITLLEFSEIRRKDKVKIVDVGCATGFTMIRLLERGFKEVHGVDLSLAMINEARRRLIDAGHTRTAASGLHLSPDSVGLPATLGADCDAAFVNWTLHFVPCSHDRMKFLECIAEHLSEGALLVLTEKTTQSVEVKEAYYRWKRSMGLGAEVISTKEKRLSGVLEPFDVGWYLEALKKCGFLNVTVYRAKYGFVTFIARMGVLVRKDSISKSLDTGLRVWTDLCDADYEAVDKDASFSLKAWGKGNESTWSGGTQNGSIYGIVYNGNTTISTGSRSFVLYAGMYFACPGPVSLHGGSGVLQKVDNHRALFSIGGPVEPGAGRLQYIDGCTDTLLLPPSNCGAPCLNHLHFPSGVQQTMHTHPSGRSGLVIRGRGVCVSGEGTRIPLGAGVAFMIPAEVVHAFETTSDSLDVIAFHPDSDFGPTNDDHPMVNRTMIGGVSASTIARMQTGL